MNAHSVSIPVVTLDGPTASGKGTVAARVAATLGYHLLDSGALYRLTALSATRAGVPSDAVDALASLAAGLDVRFGDDTIEMGGEDVSRAIREEAIGLFASAIAVHQPVRDALVARQHGFRRAPGLVADGRDMGSVIFPDAPVKVFLTASVEARAARRYKQLKEKGFSANIQDLSEALRERDARDTARAAAPLVAPQGAHRLDTSEMMVDQAVESVLGWCRDAGLV
ncbi:(d)CMP kinase [Chitinasiproducens palmae]|uniref:Cytidylate kinase n=1 Tax=Chitinasiproducens palmae TaxID=1770053 RepID=A0A1H2PWY8_9BURK|nr:(d)CMP kinase [Chitinasiproducens palmae]SDV51094.1 cytidylate kinase [Chitinasiproducens palmae]